MRRDPRGFTMLEVMISLSILAVLTAIVWVSVNNMFRARDFMTERYERFQIIRVALDRMNSELSSAYIAGPSFGAEEKYEESASNETSDDGSAESVKQRRENAEAALKSRREPVQFGMVGRDDEVSFTSFSHMRMFRDEPTSYHAEIGYFVERRRTEDGDFAKSLMRREDTTLDDDITEGGKVYVLIPKVEEVQFEYWDPGETKLGQSQEDRARGNWVDDWDTRNEEYHDRLPTRIRVTVTLPPQNDAREEETFSTQTKVMSNQLLEY
jgi:general secretion pathway protein J